MATQGIIVAIGGIKHKFKPGTALSKIEAYFSKLGHASVVLTDSEGYAIVDDPVEPGEYVATASKPNEQKTDDADGVKESYCNGSMDVDGGFCKKRRIEKSPGTRLMEFTTHAPPPKLPFMFKHLSVIKVLSSRPPCHVCTVTSPKWSDTRVIKVVRDKEDSAREFKICRSLKNVDGVARMHQRLKVTVLSQQQNEFKRSALLMEYHPGCSGYLPLPSSHNRHFFCFFSKLLEVLIAMEKKDITHCDIHPRNILYDEPTCTLTLVDFGEAKMGDLTPPPFRSPVVSVFNCPPERYGARGFNSNATTDAWAVGVIYFMAVLRYRSERELPSDPNELLRLVSAHKDHALISPAEILLNHRPRSRRPVDALAALKGLLAS